MDTTTAAYLAGIIDADGSVGIYITKSGTSYRSHALQVTLAMTVPDAVYLMAAETGSPAVHKSQRENSKLQYAVVIRSDRASVFLQQIVPYMRVKREQALLGIEFQDAKTNWSHVGIKGGYGRGKARLTEEEWLLRETYRLRMYGLNSGRLGLVPKSRVAAETEWRGSSKSGRQATVRPGQECPEASRNDWPPPPWTIPVME